jgi:hypothetical protein
MPVLNLLWGSDSLNATECVNDSVRITQTIMGNLKHRVSAEVSLHHLAVVIAADLT